MRMHTLKYLVLLLSSLIYVHGCAAVTETQSLEQLRDDFSTLQQLQTELKQYQKAGSLSQKEIADYKTWVRQIEDRVAESCLALRRAGDTQLPADLPCNKILASYSISPSIDVKNENTEAEKTAGMLDQLNGSLGEFDERLLREQDRVKSKKPYTDTSGGSAGGGGGGGGAGASSGNTGGNGKESASETGESEKAGSQSGRQAGRQSGTQSEEGERHASGGTGTPSGAPSAHKTTAPQDIPDGRNDDVIARQLREAAEKETDPELRKKLWDEYRRYKGGSR